MNIVKRTIFVVLGVAFSFFVFTPCLEAKIAGEDKLISIQVNGEPMGKILSKIAQSVGYQLIMDSEYANLPITVSFKDLTLETAFGRILGNLNRTVFYNEAEKTISLNIVEYGKKTKNGFSISDMRKNISTSSNIDFEIVPPDETGKPSVTLKEVEVLRHFNGEDPDNLELVPPTKGGEKGATLADINHGISNPESVEIVPPNTMGGKRITLNQIKLQKELKE